MEPCAGLAVGRLRLSSRGEGLAARNFDSSASSRSPAVAPRFSLFFKLASAFHAASSYSCALGSDAAPGYTKQRLTVSSSDQSYQYLGSRHFSELAERGYKQSQAESSAPAAKQVKQWSQS